MYLYFFAFCWFRLLDYPSLLSRNTKYIIPCLISQHSHHIWLTFCDDIHSKCKSYLFKYSCKKCSHNRKQFMFDIFCYSQPTSKYVLSLKETFVFTITFFVLFYFHSFVLKFHNLFGLSSDMFRIYFLTNFDSLSII